MRASLRDYLFLPLTLCSFWLGEGVVLPASMSAQQPVSIAPVKLRGYGTVSSNWQSLPGLGSVLKIDSETPELADLMLAKYLSDLGEMRDIADLKLSAKTGSI